MWLVSGNNIRLAIRLPMKRKQPSEEVRHLTLLFKIAKADPVARSIIGHVDLVRDLVYIRIMEVNIHEAKTHFPACSNVSPWGKK
jgi:hypothetical protein